jgi:hypothetical protein
VEPLIEESLATDTSFHLFLLIKRV